jgi:hypothetical protein
LFCYHRTAVRMRHHDPYPIPIEPMYMKTGSTRMPAMHTFGHVVSRCKLMFGQEVAEPYPASSHRPQSCQEAISNPASHLHQPCAISPHHQSSPTPGTQPLAKQRRLLPPPRHGYIIARFPHVAPLVFAIIFDCA